jgi:hypothetical protein
MPEPVGYETRDVSVPGLAGFALGFAIAIFFIFLIVAGLYKLFHSRHPTFGPPSRIELKPRMLAPAPQLESNPTVDLERFRRSEEDKLNSCGWIDKNAGIIRIPIERAMDLIAQRGLPTRGPGTQNSSGKTPEDLQREKAAATAPKP